MGREEYFDPLSLINKFNLLFRILRRYELYVRALFESHRSKEAKKKKKKKLRIFFFLSTHI